MASPSASQRHARLATAACVALPVLFAAPMFFACGGVSCHFIGDRGSATGDARVFALFWESARQAIVYFHEFPSWLPYHCGGVPLYQDPQAPFPGPMFLLALALPSLLGLKLWILAHLVAGSLGAQRLARDAGAAPPEETLAALIAVGCGFCAQHFGGGHLAFTPFLLLPWLLWAERRAAREVRYAVVVGALLALAAVEGGVYPVPLMALTLILDALLHAGRGDERRRLVVALPLGLALAPLLAAVRLVPLASYLARHPRPTALDDGLAFDEIFEAWLARDHERHFPPHIYVWPEYGDYIGPTVVALLLVGVVVAALRRDPGRRGRRIDLALLALLVWLAMGDRPTPSLFGLVHRLPVFASLRVPSRFLYPATLAAAALCARTLAALREMVDERAGRRALFSSLRRALPALEWALVLVVALDLWIVNAPHFQEGQDAPLPGGPPATRLHMESGAGGAPVSQNPALGIGTTRCFVPIVPDPATGMWFGEVPQERIDPPDAGTVSELRWTPSSLTVRVELARSATLLYNQNFDPGWSATEGTPGPQQGIVGLPLGPGVREVTLRHRPPGLLLGALLSLLGGIAARLAWRRSWGMIPARMKPARPSQRSA